MPRFALPRLGRSALVAAALAAVTSPLSAQCSNTSQYPSTTIPINPSGAWTTITTCNFSGEYSVLSGAVAGQQLEFDSSIATDFVTIRSGSPGGAVLGFGTQPLSVANTFTGTIYAHWNSSAACLSDVTCRQTRVRCASCGGGGCINGTQYPSTPVAIDPSGGLVQISSCSFAGEYSVITGAVAGQTLAFTSSVATDYITVRSGTPGGPIVAQGTTALSFVNTFTGTLYAHWNTNASCGTSSSCRTTTVQCTSCVAVCTLTCPPDVNVGTTAGFCTGTATYAAPSGSGTCGSISCTPPSGSVFALGTTVVSCASQTGGGACGFSVTVADTQAPTVSTPDLQVGTDPGLCSAVVAYGATVSDNCPGVAAATCTPPSGSTFPLGTTPTSCSTTDAAGNGAADPGSVTVVDDEAPVLAACPADLFVSAPPGALSLAVDFTEPAATDNCSPPGSATCAPAPGDPFPVGTTTVACVATDGSGNDASCAFDVAVGSESIQEIPAASTLGLVALALLLGAAALLVLRRSA